MILLLRVYRTNSIWAERDLQSWQSEMSAPSFIPSQSLHEELVVLGENANASSEQSAVPSDAGGEAREVNPRDSQECRDGLRSSDRKAEILAGEEGLREEEVSEAAYERRDEVVREFLHD